MASHCIIAGPESQVWLPLVLLHGKIIHLTILLVQRPHHVALGIYDIQRRIGHPASRGDEDVRPIIAVRKRQVDVEARRYLLGRLVTLCNISSQIATVVFLIGNEGLLVGIAIRNRGK